MSDSESEESVDGGESVASSVGVEEDLGGDAERTRRLWQEMDRLVCARWCSSRRNTLIKR